MSNYKQSVTTSRTHFARAPQGELEFSTIYSPHTLLTTFNAGEIVPILCEEVLPHDTWSLDLNAIIRQSTLVVPTMGQLYADFYAFFVPNRVVNHSWKNVMGENTSGMWTAPQISLATLGGPKTGSIKIPIGSVADYYGYPTQSSLRAELLQQMHDLKFRGYLEIYNTYFRDENYQPPIPYSKLNVYNGFFSYNFGSSISAYGDNRPTINVKGVEADGSVGAGAVVKALAGDGGELYNASDSIQFQRKVAWSALRPPLKANKFHDYFTTCLPDSQKGRAVTLPIFGQASLNTSGSVTPFGSNIPLELRFKYGPDGQYQHPSGNNLSIFARQSGGNVGERNSIVYGNIDNNIVQNTNSSSVYGSNLYADLSTANAEITIEQLRISSAMQQVYEILGRSGSRYTEYVTAFFGIETENPFDDIPTYLGHFRRELDLYQTAQTSASGPVGSQSTPQGTLTAYGYTDKGGHLFTKTFLEHGYVHVFCVIRHKNVYSSYLGRDNFRLSMMDFYQYPLANISEQPVYTREINPFRPDSIDAVFGYQEPWAEYRFSPDRCSGHFRSQPEAQAEYDLTEWNYADTYDYNLVSSNGSWLQSNTAEVVARTTAYQDREFPQFKAQIVFNCKKERPMPTYSVAGLDII